MQKVVHAYSLILAVVAIIIASFGACSETTEVPPPVLAPVDSSNVVSFEAHGGNEDLDNKFVSFNDFNTTVTQAGYIDSLGVTEISVLGQWQDEVAYMELIFPGNELATFFLEEPQPPNFEPTSGEYFYLRVQGTTDLHLKYMNVFVTEYGEIGERIKGTFNGMMYEYSTGEEQTVSVQNGTFNLLRTF